MAVAAVVDAHVSKLVLTVQVLFVPALALALPAIPALVSTTALIPGRSGWARWSLVVLSALAWLIEVAWIVRVVRIRRAVSDQDQLALEFTNAFELFDIDGPVLERILANFEGGKLRLWRRLTALWRTITIPDFVSGQVGALSRARWFLPPLVGTTVLRFWCQVWMTAALWLVAVGGTSAALAKFW